MRRPCAATVLAIILAACTSSAGNQSTTTTTAPVPSENVLEDVVAEEWEPETRTEEIAAEISDGNLSAQLAIDALALIVDGVPGSSSSSLPPGEGFSGFYTRLLIESVRDELTPEQITFADDYYASGRLVGSVSYEGVITPATEAGAAGLTAGIGFIAPSELAAGSSETADELKVLELVEEVHQRWKARFPEMPHFDVEVYFSDKPGGMEAWNDGKCHIRLFDEFTQKPASDDKIRWYLAHEMFHCIQHLWIGTVEPPGWVMDGSADWAAYDLFRNEELDFEGGSDDWFRNAYRPLKAREYSAWPLYENAARSGLDVYASIKAMVTSPGPTPATTLSVGGLDGQVFRRDWSTRTLRTKSFDSIWWLPWPTHAPESGPQGNNYALERGLGSYNIVGAAGFASPQLAVVMAPEVDLVTASPLGGPLTTWTTSGTLTVADGESATFCFSPDRCRCPAGMTSSAIQMNSRVMIFSFPASEEAPKAAVNAQPWKPDNVCKEEPENDEAESNGDPHLLTFDGLPYDVITLGEFVTARDPNGDFEVQTRHEPFMFGAGTTAVALGTGTSRITFTTPDFFTPQPEIRIDGVTTDKTEFEAGGVTVQVGETEIIATWPDGSTVELRWFLGWFVEVSVPLDRSARMEGLLGSADGDFGNDLQFPDGTVVDTVDAQSDESPFVLAWAVDDQTSLFDYEQGQSTATFRIPHPNPVPPPIDDAVSSECAAALGEGATAHEVRWCAYDVSATGDTGFVDQYVYEVEDRVGDGQIPDLPEPTPTTTTVPTAESVAGEPTLVLDLDNRVGTLDAIEGTVLVGIADGCPDGLFADLGVYVADDTSLLARASLCDPSGVSGVGADDDEWHNGEAYVWLPGETNYEVVLEFSLGDHEQFGQVAIYTDPTPAVTEAGDLDSDNRRSLDGIADTVVYLPDPDMRFDLTGFDEACGVEVYWLDTFPRLDPYHLRHCLHPDEYDQPPTDQVVPLVVFSRTEEPVEITMSPRG